MKVKNEYPKYENDEERKKALQKAYVSMVKSIYNKDNLSERKKPGG